jgi:hypothetical protein
LREQINWRSKVFYSAQIKADYQRFVRTFGALMDIAEFTRLFFERAEGVSRAKVPKAMEDAFRSPHTEAEREIKVLIDQFNADQTTKLEQDLFYENVSKARMEGTLSESHERDANVVLEFRPSNGELMHAACLWSRWSAPGEPDLLSFAAITDEPPPEVAAAGHDRCIIPIKPENLDNWLNPDASNLEAMYAILDDRDRPDYVHRLAA